MRIRMLSAQQLEKLATEILLSDDEDRVKLVTKLQESPEGYVECRIQKQARLLAVIMAKAAIECLKQHRKPVQRF